MQSQPIFNSVSSLLHKTMQDMTEPSFYLQLILIGIAAMLAFLVHSFAKRQLQKHTHLQQTRRVVYWVANVMTALAAPVTAIVALSLCRAVSLSLTETASIIAPCTKLAVAWLAARLVAHVVHSRFIAILLSYAILIVALLSVTKLLDGTAEFLDSLAFEIGQVRLSALVVLKAALLLSVLIWMVNATSRGINRYLMKHATVSLNSRDMIVKLTRIVLFFIAFLVTLNTVGIDLTALAVFGGALGVGIGFGLQKITANFISGIILLFERSVKIGDFIEVGNDSGWVREMAVRYTLVELFDGREALLPNEQLITSRVVNWTFNNRRSRIDIPVPVTYGNDVNQVRTILLAVANDHPLALKDPAPACFLREFSTSGMQFLLTLWLDDFTVGRFKTQSQIMFEIVEKFAEHNIAMSAPTREIYLQPYGGETDLPATPASIPK